MSWDDVIFTFPFTVATLLTVVIAYLTTLQPLLKKEKLKIMIPVWVIIAGALTILFMNVDWNFGLFEQPEMFTHPVTGWGYGPRYLAAVLAMIASRIRLSQSEVVHKVGPVLREILMIVVTIVAALLFVGLR